MAEAANQTCTFIKSRRAPRNVRKRDRDDATTEPQEEDSGSAVVKKTKQLKATPLTSSSKAGLLKQAKEKRLLDDIDDVDDLSTSAQPVHTYVRRQANHSEADGPEAERTQEEEDAEAIRREQVKTHTFGANRSSARSGAADQLATATNEAESTERRGSKSQQLRSGRGPIRAPLHIRVSCRFDYQPDICKDYYETGYCGFGDSCKFAHMREDYKSGWQLEKEWEEEQAKKRKMRQMGISEEEEEDDDEEEDLPFACFICREPFVDPVVTKCKHYFCSSCAMEHYKTDTKCYVCKAQTFGIFNTANDIIRRMKQRGISRDKDGGDDDGKADEDEIDEAEVAVRDVGARRAKLESSAGWAIPADFNDAERKGKSNWL